MFNDYDTPNNGGDPVALAALRLVAAMVKRARRDAGRGDPDARAWLAWLRGEVGRRDPLGDQGQTVAMTGANLPLDRKQEQYYNVE